MTDHLRMNPGPQADPADLHKGCSRAPDPAGDPPDLFDAEGLRVPTAYPTPSSALEQGEDDNLEWVPGSSGYPRRSSVSGVSSGANVRRGSLVRSTLLVGASRGENG
jgi:hypothetical protein